MAAETMVAIRKDHHGPCDCEVKLGGEERVFFLQALIPTIWSDVGLRRHVGRDTR